MISFTCDKCGHDIEVEDSHAGRAARCGGCGAEVVVPSGGFRLRPIPEDERDEARPGPVEAYDLLGDEPPPVVLEAPEPSEDGPGDAPSGGESIPEEFLADRAPLALDENEVADDDTGPIPLSE